MPEDSRQLPRRRECAECGCPVRGGDGGIVVNGKLYCCDACADGDEAQFEEAGYYGGYGEDPLGGAW